MHRRSDHENFNAATSMKIWYKDVVWRPNQNPRGKYKDQAKKQTLLTLIDLESDEDIDMIQLGESDKEAQFFILFISYETWYSIYF